MAGGLSVAVMKNGVMPCRAAFFAEGMEDGAAVAAEFYGVCLFGETHRELMSADGRAVTCVGRAVIDGDAAPGLAALAGGTFTVDTPSGERRLRIARARRVRAGGLRVRHTVLELM